MEVFVFKTNIKYKYQIKELKNELDKLGKWNFDLEDCDKILRIESCYNITFRVIKIFYTNNLQCEELL